VSVRGERRGPERRSQPFSQRVRIVLLAALVGGVFAAVSLDANLRDGLRIFVLAQAVIVTGLYAQAVYNVARRVRHPGPDKVTNEIRRGHLCMLLAIFVLLFEEILRVVHRIGEPIVNWRTPLLQLALWLLFLGWLWLERREWQPPNTPILKPTPKEEARNRARLRVERQS
jgi:hypothetical protein